MPLSPGQVLLNRYRIDAPIGQGGMGAVYDAYDMALGLRAALKENLVFTDSARRQFEREARLLAGLHHPHLPRVTDHFVVPDQGQYLVMDFIEGEDLRQHLERAGPLPPADVQRWGEVILEALIYLHARRILHRDIKPANLKLTPGGEPVLVDFGIARAQDATGQTQTTTARGFTAGFAAPEQYGVGGGLDARADLYALGATLYNLLTGAVPTDALMRIIRPGALLPLASLRLDLPPHLTLVVDRALELDPDDRFPDAAVMLAALRAGAGQLPRQPAAPLPARPASAPLRFAHPFPLELVRIPGGEFRMGSRPEDDPDAQSEELPQHPVSLSAYAIGKYPVTNAQYAAFLRAARHRPADAWAGLTPPPGKEDHPAVNVRWTDAVAFCEWLSRETGRLFRLPTEAEWEMAARGVDGRLYPWGSHWDTGRLPSASRRGLTLPVGHSSPHSDSPHGVADLLGNIWEWCADWFSAHEYHGRTGVSVDPVGPAAGRFRVTKGGVWLDSGRKPRCAQRFKTPNQAYDHLGFRVVLPASADTPAPDSA